jgi:putative hydrolase of the HAD superfamily
MQSLKAILTDLDGVIRYWTSEALNVKEERLGLTKGHLFGICFEKNILAQVVTGQISDREWREIVQARLSSSISKTDAKELVKLWANSEIQIDKKIVEIYKQHFPGVKIVLTTNATTRLREDLKNQGLEDKIDEIMNSSELGVAKPAHEYFIEVLSRLGVRMDEVIYIDDTAANVEAASELGIRSHHYQNHKRLVEFLIDTQETYSATHQMQ